MRTFAPGKLVLTGAYAVLEGAPAIAIAVSRGAFADTSRKALAPTPEVRAALGDLAAPHVDASAMFTQDEAGTRKLGLGASAAILVASLAAVEADAGADLSSVRDRLFARARAAHAQAQSGGSGVDVAVSVYGGTVRYVVGAPVANVALPRDLDIAVFACGVSARTSDLRAQVDRVAATNPAAHRAAINELVATATLAANAVDAGDAAEFVRCLRRTARGLAALGVAAGVEIVPVGFDALEEIAAREHASFSVSGAGGGDVAVYVGPQKPSREFAERARALGLLPVPLSHDHKGVRNAPAVSAIAEPPRVLDQP